MPAFTFEKLSPPARRASNAPAADQKRRGAISSVLDRLAGARGKRSPQKERAVSARKQPKSQETKSQETKSQETKSPETKS